MQCDRDPPLSPPALILTACPHRTGGLGSLRVRVEGEREKGGREGGREGASERGREGGRESGGWEKERERKTDREAAAGSGRGK